MFLGDGVSKIQNQSYLSEAIRRMENTLKSQ